MNWGYRIVLAFVCFAAFIGYMVTRAFQEDFDLVAEDYYAQEINYQQKLTKLANTEVSGRKVSIDQQQDHILFEFPDQNFKGTIEFYHPSREKFDKTFALNVTEGVQMITKEELIPGNYHININWKVGEYEFLQESKIFIQ